MDIYIVLFQSITAVVALCSIALSTFCTYRANTSLDLMWYKFGQTSIMITLVAGVTLLVSDLIMLLF